MSGGPSHVECAVIELSDTPILPELARIWKRAALLERQSINHDSPAQACCRFQVFGNTQVT
jgi:hypothetical protein